MRATKTWAEEIADVTGDREYQTCDIEIADYTDVTTTRDWVTGETVTTGEPIGIYTGQARIVGVRSATLIEGVDQSNATSLKSVRLQVPRKAIGHLSRGQYVRITSAPQNPTLERYVYKVNSDFQGSSAATRTFEIGVDLDSEWGAISG